MLIKRYQTSISQFFVDSNLINRALATRKTFLTRMFDPPPSASSYQGLTVLLNIKLCFFEVSNGKDNLLERTDHHNVRMSILAVSMVFISIHRLWLMVIIPTCFVLCNTIFNTHFIL